MPGLTSREELATDLRWGGIWGAALALAFTAVGGFLLSRQGLAAPRSVAFVSVVYFALFVPAGLFAGLMRPLLQSDRGAVAVGAAIGCVVYSAGAGLAVLTSDLAPEFGGFLAAGLGGAFFGGITAYWIRH